MELILIRFVRGLVPLLVGALLASAIAGCSSSSGELQDDTTQLDLTMLDTTIRPQDDFYLYANGGWLKRTPIPPSVSSWSVFEEQNAIIEQKCLALLKEASQLQAYAQGSDVKKAIYFYDRAMDSLLAEKTGISSVKIIWNKINEIKNKADLQRYLAEQQRQGEPAFFSVYSQPKFTNGEIFGVNVGVTTLGLPSRDFYLLSDPKSKETKVRYEAHVAAMLGHAGVAATQARREASSVVAIESFLARAMLSREDASNPAVSNNPRSVQELNRLMPSINWSDYLFGLGLRVDTLNVDQPLYLREVERLLFSFSSETWKSYLRWTVLRRAAPYLNHALTNESFEFNERYLRGVEKMMPRWRRAMRETNAHFGDAIGKLYVKQNFKAETRTPILAIVDNVRLAMAARIKQADWMTDSTKEASLRKLQKMSVKIGYPDKWRSYARLTIESDTLRSSFYEGVRSARRFEVEENLSQAGKRVDHLEWTTTAQTVGAFYNSFANEIILPAGVLQSPLYLAEGDDALNYGAIGVLIGHEIMHAFDENGSQFDDTGKLNDEWNPIERKKLEAVKKQLALPHGKMGLTASMSWFGSIRGDELLADLGGVTIAYEGLQRQIRERGKVNDGHSLPPEHRFFLSWATTCRTKYRTELPIGQAELSNRGMIRVWVPLSNMPVFYRVFDVGPGDKMYREEADRIQIW